MKNFSAFRPAVHRPFQKKKLIGGGASTPLCGRGLKGHQTESKHGTWGVDHDHVDLRLKLYQNTEFDGIQSGPPKFESVAGEIYLDPDTKVS